MLLSNIFLKAVIVKMYNDDSFNDSDEIFNLYSSKTVTETFKAQLHKLVSINPNLTNGLDIKNNESALIKQDEKRTTEHHVKESQLTSKCKEAVSEGPFESVENVLEDSIEIISEQVSKKVPRRSGRLRQKARINSSLNSPDYDLSLYDNERSQPFTRSRKRAATRKKKQKSKQNKVTDEIFILDDSPQPCENSEDELNPEVSVKVIWKSVSVKKFQIRKFQKLSKIYEQLSKEENIPEDKIMLTFNNVKVNRNDTPDSLNLQVYHFIDGGVLSELTNSCESSNLHLSNCDDNFITLKFQDKNKKIVKLAMNKNNVMKVGMIKYAEQLEIPLEKIKFFFDGELIEPSETPHSLGLENDEIIDVKICG